jgi:hypothetical protein
MSDAAAHATMTLAQTKRLFESTPAYRFSISSTR